MTSFALITEGITDQAILENLLDGLTDGKAITRALRPLRDETDLHRVAHDEFSNWGLVLEFISSEDILDAIQTNDFIVIQIDTDVCEDPKIGIALHEGGNFKEISLLVQAYSEKLHTFLHKDFPPEEKNRILFAIPVLSSECWLISLNDPGHTHCSKTVIDCEQRLNNLLKRKKITYRKEYEIYSKISKGFRKSKTLEAVANRVICLKIFLDQTRAQLPA